MRPKPLAHWFILFSLLTLLILAWSLLSSSSVSAQCENPPKSSCLSCHEEIDHLAGMGEWNKVHLNQDMCISCHGGNASAAAEDLAHLNMIAQPLSDIYTDCHSCHPVDYIERSDQLGAAVNVSPASCATPTLALLNNTFSEPPMGGSSISSQPIRNSPLSEYFALILAGSAGLALFLLGIAWLEKHRLPG